MQATESDMEEGSPIYGCVTKLTTTIVSWCSILPASSEEPCEMHFRTVHQGEEKRKHPSIACWLLPPIGQG